MWGKRNSGAAPRRPPRTGIGGSVPGATGSLVAGGFGVLVAGHAFGAEQGALVAGNGIRAGAWVGLALLALLAVAAAWWWARRLEGRLRQAETALKDSDAIFTQFLEHSPIHVFFKDEAIRSIRLSRSYERMLGRPIEDILGKTMDELFPPDLAAAIVADDTRILREGKLITVEEELDGRFYETIKFPIVVAGHPKYLAGFTIDITDRKRAGEALRESEERFARAFRASPAAMSISRIEDGFNIDVNDEWQRLTGFGRDEVLGKTATDLGSWPAMSQRAAFIARLKRDGSFRNFEATLRTKRGELRDVVLAGETIDLHGEPHLLLAFHDITARKLAEHELIAQREMLDTIIETIPHGIFWKDLNGVYTACNTVAARNWGFERREDIVGKTVFDLARSREEAETLTATDRIVLEQGKPLINFEDTHVLADGSIATHLSSKLPLRDAAGNVTGLVCLFLDVTDQRRAEERLRQAQKMEVVGQLAGGTAHDFNNLLQVIQANLELIGTEEDGNKETGPYVEAAMNAVSRGARLSQQLLSFSRQQALCPDTVDANGLIERTVRLLGHTLGENVEIETRLEAGLAPVFVDPNGLENALLNLALNARAAMPEGGRLTIASTRRRRDAATVIDEGVLPAGDYVEIAVIDDGCGMDQTVRDRAFEPFFTTKDVGEGSGLGLSMVYGFALQSGGHASLESEPGKGTTARLLLLAALARPAGLGESAQKAPVRAGTGTVLVVEDDPDVRRSVVGTLRRLGYSTREAGTGAAALAELAGDTAIEVVFTDVVMPGGMNGLELAREAVRRRPGVRVLLTSGYPEAALAKAKDEQGHLRMLHKPYTTAQLSEAITSLLA